MNITVNEELQRYIDPLTPQEHDSLERSGQVVIIEKIQKQAAPELVAAAMAGKNELKQAAKRVREEALQATAPHALQTLQQRVAELTAENGALRTQVAQSQARLDN